MLDAPWPPPHDGPHQPRDAHGPAWSDDVLRPSPPPPAAAAWWPADAPRGAARRHAGEDGGRPGPGPRPASTHRGGLPEATWLPEPAWIPQPSPAPEQRWTPEHDWVATFARRDPAVDAAPPARRLARWLVAGAVAVVVVPLAALALVLGS
ncbi:hypothetical protein GC089_01200 [Cellulomonas sp. JZ18]|uniref:hypothetical protein n=1 Tax=Cellulomonas sp. JZ18 TaxID=2654191 RepID=UPI0012D411B0|nr:hypothetical protein [Cellulomonas sp. JZ18]QGQ18135.1 hypothetical protein GC089_01200 [Cellulomonas sp. JZ18]